MASIESLRTYLQRKSIFIVHPQVREHLLMLLTVIGIVVGLIISTIIRYTEMHRQSDRELMYLLYPGEIYINMLKSLILPLIISSLISAVGRMDLSLSRRIGVQAIAYYMLTTVMAVTLGIILVTTIKPGSRMHEKLVAVEVHTKNMTLTDTFLDLVR
ncbi:excitatory amino acid transporter 3-like [Culicoides brevitarsis]|uniref:excitatory amino acid transporter 3-like n=1 Tax=Culicoides brevitarsis TaxID=469753 RepID=UPI00307B99B1